MEPVGLKVPVFGSYISAEAVAFPVTGIPPAMRTRPSASSVAVWQERSVVIGPIGAAGIVGPGVAESAAVGVGEGAITIARSRRQAPMARLPTMSARSSPASSRAQAIAGVMPKPHRASTPRLWG